MMPEIVRTFLGVYILFFSLGSMICWFYSKVDGVKFKDYFKLFLLLMLFISGISLGLVLLKK